MSDSYTWPSRAVSADGGKVVFSSDSDGLSSADDNHGPNCFVRDRTSGTTTLVNRSSGPDGAPSGPWEECGGPMISADGNRVAFSTFASLDPHDTNGNADVYVRDLTTNATILVSRVGDAAGNGYSRVGSIDADGNLVAFTSNATSFSGRPNDLKSDVYVHDIGANTTTLLSRATGFAGALADGSSQDPSISDDGTRVAFSSYATNLSPDDNNANSDVYLRDLKGAPPTYLFPTTTLVSRASGVTPLVGDGLSYQASISGDGTHVAFTSAAKNFDPADTDVNADVYVRDFGSATTTVASRPIAGMAADHASSQPSLNRNGTKVTFQTTPSYPYSWQVYVRDLSVATPTLVSRADGAAGAAGDDESLQPSIDASGSKIAFYTQADNFADSPGSDFSQVDLRDTTANTTELVSRPGGQAVPSADVNDSLFDRSFSDSGSATQKVSRDGRYVVFASKSDGLSGADDNRFQNIFLRDTLTDTTTLVSRVGLDGSGANADAYDETISADGSTVAFSSFATNLGNTNSYLEVFVRDLASGQTTLLDGAGFGAYMPSLSSDGTKVAYVTYLGQWVNVRDLRTGVTTLATSAFGSPGVPSNGYAKSPTLNSDGTKVSFDSTSTNLVAVAPTQREVYVRDLSTETTTLVSRASSATGIYADKEASNAGLSSDGTVVAFLTRATNLDPGVSGKGDVFVRNLATNTTTLASRGNGAAGPFSNNSSHGGSLSADGNRVAFTNRAPGTLTSTPKGDVYVRDLAAATTTLVSVGAGDGEAVYPSISGNGDCVAFYAYDRGLTASDPERSDFSRIFMGTVSRECPIDPPDTAISAGPKALSNLRTPTFSLASADATAHFECRLDGAAFAACASPFTTASLSDGSHAFEARAVDPAGYVDATPAAFAWTIDATGPRLAVTVPRQRLRTVRKRGLRIVVGCSEKCTIATNLKHGRRVVGTARGAATAARKTTLYVKLTKRERRALTHRRRVTLKLSTNAADGLGNRAKTDVRNLKLKR